MIAKKPEQLELIDPPEALYRTELAAPGAPKRPYYRVSIFYREGFGYLVEKASGAAGAKPVIECWFRPSLHQALEKKSHLITAKLSKKRKGRIYVEVNALCSGGTR